MAERRKANTAITHPERRKQMLNNGRNVTWQWLVGVLISVLLLAAGVILADTRNGVDRARISIVEMQKEKVDKEQYRLDMGEIKESLRTIVIKLDNIKR